MQNLAPLPDEEKRKETAEKLRESEERFRTVVEAATDAIVQCRDGKVIFWNKSAERIFGYKAAEVIGKPVISLMSEKIAEKHQKGLDRYLTTGESKIIGKKPYETCARRKDGTLIPVELSLTKNEAGPGISFTGILRNITERKEAQKKLNETYEIANRISKTLQQSLLPSDIPRISGLEIKFYYQATGEGEVGGDFFDVFKTALDTYGIIVGDVAGKGIEVAAETARVKYLLRDRAFDGSSPSTVIYRVNNALLRQGISRFTTLTYATYDSLNSNFEIANAGNPFPYVLHNDTFLQLSGVPVSIFEKEKYESASIKLHKGDLILMYTDGIVEARRQKELFGEERVRQFVKGNRALSLNNLLKSLVKEARTFSQDNLRDDILIVGIKKEKE